MQLSLETSVSMITVLVQGLLSFFSPCVFPLVPLYMSYLAGGMQTVGENGEIIYPRKKIFIHTVGFVLGIGASFLLLGFSFTMIGQFFKEYQVWIARISGIIMIFFGLYQLGIFKRNRIIEGEHRLHLNMEKVAMNPISAWVLGFTFSFAWTPCVGPTLTSVLLMAGNAETAFGGLGLILVYIVGFTFPFLAVGLFTGEVLTFFRKHYGVMKYTVKIGAILMIVIGIMTLTGWMDGVSRYFSNLGSDTAVTQEEEEPVADLEPTEEESEVEEEPETNEEKTVIPAPTFTLVDQYGVEHKLEDYKGKTIFLNFWATWCGPCKAELPDIQSLYEHYGENKEDLVVLGVANPGGQDASKEEITEFLKENGCTYPTLFDETGELFNMYGISAFPTTFMIDANGNVYGYVSGMLSADMMVNIVEQTMDSTTEE